MPKVTSETLETEQKIGAAGRGNTMALKDELVRESHQKKCLTSLLKPRNREQKIGAAGRGNTMALKDELVRESHPKKTEHKIGRKSNQKSA